MGEPTTPVTPEGVGGAVKADDVQPISSLSRAMWRRTRAPRKSRGYDPGPDCAVCGYKRGNVRHETDPEHAPEGYDYFRPMLAELHPFATTPVSDDTEGAG